MDKENKYYSQIENLVKNHRKFSGYEAILEDIIDDVYLHSKSVVDALSDENLINTYLEKVVSTSIITVPKKLNFHKELKQKPITADTILQPKPEILQNTIELPKEEKENIHKPVVSPDTNINNAIVSEAEVVERNEIQKANPDFVEKMINSIEADSIVETNDTEENTIADLADTLEENEPLEPPAKNNSMEHLNYADISDVDNLDDLVVDDENTLEDAGIDSIGEIAPEEKDNTQMEGIYEPAEDDEFEEVSIDNALDDIENINGEYEISEQNEDELSSDFLDLEESDAKIEEDITAVDENTSELELEETGAEIEEDIAAVDENTSELELEETGAEIEEDITAVDENTSELELEEIDEEDNKEIIESEDIVETDILSDSEKDIEQAGDIEPLNSFEAVEDIDNDVVLNSDDSQDNDLIADSSNDLSIDISEADDIQQNFEIDQLEELSNDDIMQENNDLLQDNIDIADTDMLPEVIDSSLEIENNIDSELDTEINFAEDNSLQEYDNVNLEEPLQNDEIITQTDVMEYKQPDFSVFDYSPLETNDNISSEDLSSKILELNDANPDSHIIEIFDLKYKQKESVNQIAEKLELTKQDVIAALDKIVNLV